MDLAPSPPPHSTGASFPIIAVAIIGILATAFLLVSYYIFVIKCCLNWHRIDLLRRFSPSQNRNRDDPVTGYSPAVENRGLDESIIRAIPIFRFKKVGNDFGEKISLECAVCLSEFRDDEKLRKIPNCSHVFHIDCIDIWLQSNANCPLCRNSISLSPERPQLDPDSAPSSSSVDAIATDEDFVAIELGIHSFRDEARTVKKGRNLKKVNSMGDECIDSKGRNDEQFAVEPIRRSFSLDLSANRELCLSIQEIVQQSSIGSSSSSSRPRRNYFFSFGHSKGASRSSILPVDLEPL